MRKNNDHLLSHNGRNSVSLLSSIQNLTIGNSSNNSIEQFNSHQTIDGINSNESETNYKTNQYTSLN